MLKAEKNLWEVTLNDVVKVNTTDGDTILVTLPAQSSELPAGELRALTERVGKGFRDAFAGKNVEVLVVPHGIEVQLIKGSELDDAD